MTLQNKGYEEGQKALLITEAGSADGFSEVSKSMDGLEDIVHTFSVS